ncbi:hypothetical protein PHYSODRAFT_336955 [Phytophthora sojae]|uniref:Uncharacterized protein n=1 Tax=Phytophthora sojae (strain P6497) TaxID=1094619 RepID=G4ZXB7_PHYSP|nr:hypothetical protein PHYSODRAFT_336955 [Phytophthora sojae]EGZ12533.1 hypothetical protein PHYSODRAFT_336955 [Phytophthora sojae]|eukprot:XP_009532866.1 hypothetical protein PHYSODRAFT_336955 [Phytophthora sojae]
MSKPQVDKSSVDSLKFNGKSLHFAAWKSKLIIYLRALSEQHALEELQRNRAKPLARFEDLLESQPELHPRPPAADKDATWQHDLHETLLNQQSSYIKRLLCETLPGGFKGIATKQMDEPVHVIWRVVEKQYSLSNAAGVVGLVQQFLEMVNADLKSVGQLLQDLNNVRSQVNVNAHEALHTHMITSKMMLVMMLGVLPRHMWGSSVKFTEESFTLGKVSEKLTNIFGNKTKSEIRALASGKPVNHVKSAPVKVAPANPKGSVLGKRKAADGPINDVHYNVGYMKCHYCAGAQNDRDGIGPHKMLDCPARRAYRAACVFRRNVWTYPSRKARKEVHEPTPKMKGNGKGKAKERREIPLAECLAKVVSVDACDAQQDSLPATPDGWVHEPAPKELSAA